MGKKLSRVAILFALSLINQACSPVGVAVTAADSSSGANYTALAAGPVCTIGVATLNKPTKVLFIMDVTGSSANTTSKSGVVTSYGSDDGKVWRTKVVTDFISKYSSNQNISYGLISFADNGTKSYINNGNVPGFTNDPNVVLTNALPAFQQTQDGGTTLYQVPFTAAQKMIKADSANDPQGLNNYVVVFLSDGGAKDTNFVTVSNNQYSFSAQNAANLAASVTTLLNSASNRVILNSVLYFNPQAGPVDSIAETLMGAVGTDGQGAALLVNSNQIVQINTAYGVPVQNCL